MTPYEQINNLDDLGIQAGTDFTIYLPCYYSDGEEMDLSEATEYGCTLCYFGDDNDVFAVITGICKAGTSNVMEINILSNTTKSLGNCLLVYRPYIKINSKVFKWQGLLYVSATTPLPVI